MSRVYSVLIIVAAILFIVSMALQITPVTTSIALGLSMFPTIRSGDLLICVHKNYIPITNGSIASYRSGWSSVVHRVVDIKGNIYVFRGDNNIFNEYIPSSNVVCRVAQIIPMYIWIATVAHLFSLGVVYVTKRSSRYSYTISTIAITFMVLTVVIGFSNLALMFTDTNIVKPNPLPIIVGINKNGSIVEIRFSVQLNGHVSCFSAHNNTIECYIDRDKVIVEDFYDQALRIVYRPYATYNVSVVYEFTTSI